MRVRMMPLMAFMLACASCATNKGVQDAPEVAKPQPISEERRDRLLRIVESGERRAVLRRAVQELSEAGPYDNRYCQAVINVLLTVPRSEITDDLTEKLSSVSVEQLMQFLTGGKLDERHFEWALFVFQNTSKANRLFPQLVKALDDDHIPAPQRAQLRAVAAYYYYYYKDCRDDKFNYEETLKLICDHLTKRTPEGKGLVRVLRLCSIGPDWPPPGSLTERIQSLRYKWEDEDPDLNPRKDRGDLENWPSDMAAGVALGRAGPAAVPHILKALSTTDHNSPGFDNLLFALGRVGPAGKEAIPQLRKLLAGQTASAESVLIIRVVLACVGENDKENHAFILDHLKRGTPEGKAILRVMAQTDCGSWANDEVIDALCGFLSDEIDEEFGNATLALAALGDKASKARGRIAKAARRAQSGPVGIRVVTNVALARVSSEESEKKAALQVALNALGGDNCGRGDYVAAAIVAEFVMDRQLIAMTIDLVQSSRPATAEGALLMTGMIGVPAAGATDGLIQLVEKGGKADTRQRAARTLGAVAPSTAVPKLEALLGREKDEKDEKVRQLIELDLAMLKLDLEEVKKMVKAIGD